MEGDATIVSSWGVSDTARFFAAALSSTILDNT